MKNLPMLALSISLSLFACNKKEPAAANISPEAAEVYKTRCATCHGDDGKGGGPAAAALNPKPRNYSDPAWQSSVTDEQIKTTILKGGAGVGKSALMPGAPDLEAKPEVLNGLIAKIRAFK